MGQKWEKHVLKKYKIDEKSLRYLGFGLGFDLAFPRSCDVIVAHDLSNSSGFVDSNISPELKKLFEDAVNVLRETIGDKVVLGACINFDERFVEDQFIDLLVAGFNERKKEWEIAMWRLRFFAE
jgi:hypothetical protein